MSEKKQIILWGVKTPDGKIWEVFSGRNEAADKCYTPGFDTWLKAYRAGYRLVRVKVIEIKQ